MIIIIIVVCTGTKKENIKPLAIHLHDCLQLEEAKRTHIGAELLGSTSLRGPFGPKPSQVP